MKDHNTFIGYFGTYTKGSSQGIYSFRLDTQLATISEPTLVAELMDPTYLSISDDNKHLYANYKANGKGAVAGFKIDTDTGNLSLLGKSVSKNGSYCHLHIDRQAKNLVAASYGDGLIESYSLLDDGAISPVVSTVQHHGSGPNIERQEHAHAHFAQFTPDEKYIISVDLGMDQIITYRLEKNGLQQVNNLKVAPGSGPRHLVFHPNQQFAYIVAELQPKVIVLQFDKNKGSFETIQTIRSVPMDFTANNQGSAIHISSDGRFVYTANRGHDSIAVFSVNRETGRLSLIQLIGTEGHWPRDFALDPSENFVVASNEESGNIHLFKRNQQTGKLILLPATIQVPYPVCVKFLHY